MKLSILLKLTEYSVYEYIINKTSNREIATCLPV